jgi:hypothetical protein
MRFPIQTQAERQRHAVLPRPALSAGSAVVERSNVRAAIIRIFMRDADGFVNHRIKATILSYFLYSISPS